MALNSSPSTATKGQVADLIAEELGRAGYDFDIQPGEVLSWLRKMDALLAQWQAQGITLNYNFPASFGTSKPTDMMGVPDAALDTIAAWVAMRVAPGIGKTMSTESRKAMADGLSLLRSETAVIPCMHYPKTTAIGSGWNPWAIWRPFARYDSDNTECDDMRNSGSTVIVTTGQILAGNTNYDIRTSLGNLAPILPALSGVSVGTVIEIQDVDFKAATNNQTVMASPGDTIIYQDQPATTTFSMTINGVCLRFVSSGTYWRVFYYGG